MCEGVEVLLLVVREERDRMAVARWGLRRRVALGRMRRAGRGGILSRMNLVDSVVGRERFGRSR